MSIIAHAYLLQFWRPGQPLLS